MTSSVTLNGNVYSDTGTATGRDLIGEDRRGHTRWLMPMLADAVIDLGAKQSACAAAVSSALAHVATAQDWAIKTAGPVAGSEYSAKYHAQAAAGSGTAAASSEARASEYAVAAAGEVVKAQDWAIKTSGPVSGGEYSAKYHAQAAASSADRAEVVLAEVSTMSVGEFNRRLGLMEALVYAGL